MLLKALKWEVADLNTPRAIGCKVFVMPLDETTTSAHLHVGAGGSFTMGRGGCSISIHRYTV